MKPVTLLIFASCVVYSSSHPTHVEKVSVLKEEPTELLFKDGVSVTLRCVTEESDKNVEYTWFKGGQPLDVQHHRKYQTVDGEGSFTIIKPSASDEGKYQCRAKTNLGTARTTITVLRRTYLEIPKYSISHVKPEEGRPFKLECPAPKGYPKPTLKWVKTDEQGTQKDFMDRRAVMAPDGTLYFSNATAEDAGHKDTIKCVASSPAVEDEVDVIGYQIKEVVPSKPMLGELSVQYVSTDVVAKVGDLTYIYCIYGGTPLAHPDWYKDGKNVNNKPGDRVTRHNRSSGRRLQIKDTSVEDEGTYKCAVTSINGKKYEHTIKLTVVSEPTFTKKPEQKMLVGHGQRVVIPCQVSGIPQPKITWTNDGIPITKGVTDEGLVIEKVEKTNAGYYGCNATSEYGSIYAETALQVAKYYVK